MVDGDTELLVSTEREALKEVLCCLEEAEAPDWACFGRFPAAALSYQQHEHGLR